MIKEIRFLRIISNHLRLKNSNNIKYSLNAYKRFKIVE